MAESDQSESEASYSSNAVEDDVAVKSSSTSSSSSSEEECEAQENMEEVKGGGNSDESSTAPAERPGYDNLNSKESGLKEDSLHGGEGEEEQAVDQIVLVEGTALTKSVKSMLDNGNGTIDITMRATNFQRVFTKNDEIVILEGLKEYMKQNEGPVQYREFQKFIGKSLHVQVDKTQLYEKVRRMKSMYINMATKKKPPKNDPHDMKKYELCEQLWGNDLAIKEIEKAPERNYQNQEASSRLVRTKRGAGPSIYSVPLDRTILGDWEAIRREGLKLIPLVKLKELELKKLKVHHEEVKLVLTALRSSEQR